MPYKPLREARYQDLILLGMTRWEARVLSVIPRRVPYLQRLVQERYAWYQRLKDLGLSDKEIDTRILRRYAAKGFTKGRKRHSPETVWAMLRSYEEPYKKDHPQYKPRYKHKRARHIKRTLSNLDKTLSETQIKNRIVQLQGDMNVTDSPTEWRRMYNEVEELKMRLRVKYGQTP